MQTVNVNVDDVEDVKSGATLFCSSVRCQYRQRMGVPMQVEPGANMPSGKQIETIKNKQQNCDCTRANNVQTTELSNHESIGIQVSQESV